MNDLFEAIPFSEVEENELQLWPEYIRAGMELRSKVSSADSLSNASKHVENFVERYGHHLLLGLCSDLFEFLYDVRNMTFFESVQYAIQKGFVGGAKFALEQGRLQPKEALSALLGIMVRNHIELLRAVWEPLNAWGEPRLINLEYVSLLAAGCFDVLEHLLQFGWLSETQKECFVVEACARGATDLLQRLLTTVPIGCQQYLCISSHDHLSYGGAALTHGHADVAQMLSERGYHFDLTTQFGYLVHYGGHVESLEWLSRAMDMDTIVCGMDFEFPMLYNPDDWLLNYESVSIRRGLLKRAMESVAHPDVVEWLFRKNQVSSEEASRYLEHVSFWCSKSEERAIALIDVSLKFGADLAHHDYVVFRHSTHRPAVLDHLLKLVDVTRLPATLRQRIVLKLQTHS